MWFVTGRFPIRALRLYHKYAVVLSTQTASWTSRPRLTPSSLKFKGEHCLGHLYAKSAQNASPVNYFVTGPLIHDK